MGGTRASVDCPDMHEVLPLPLPLNEAVRDQVTCCSTLALQSADVDLFACDELWVQGHPGCLQLL